jgi:hypothetical protein
MAAVLQEQEFHCVVAVIRCSFAFEWIVAATMCVVWISEFRQEPFKLHV